MRLRKNVLIPWCAFLFWVKLPFKTLRQPAASVPPAHFNALRWPTQGKLYARP